VNVADLQALPRDDRASRLREALDAARDAMRASLAQGAGGVAACAALSQSYDATIRACWETALTEVAGARKADMALVATGGWGREHMCPYSDIDFIVLTRKPLAPVARAVADHLLYPLWDAGIRVGHAIRAPKDAVKLAGEDLATATALLDARYLAGSEALFAELSRSTARAVARHRNANDFVKRLVDEQRARHDRFGASLFLLEPNLKQGIGALRDLATGVWAAQARWGVRSAAELVQLGQLSVRQVAVINDALDFLLKVRSLLHFQIGRPSDQLSFEAQEAIAPGLYPDARLPEGSMRPAVAPAVEALMRRYYLHARGVVQVTERLLELALVPPRRRPHIAKIDPSFVAFNGKLSSSDPAVFGSNPAEMVRLFRVALEQDMPVYPHTREVIADLLSRESTLLTGHPRASALFLDALCDPRDNGQPSLLEQMHQLGILNALMPEFAPCTCRVQHDLYHVYTVDQHQLYSVALLKRVARGELADRVPNVTEAVRAIQHPVSLYLGTLLHDVGKPLGKGHAEKGAQLAGTIGRRLGMSEDDVERTEFLVRQHLTMAHLSQRRDLSDDEMIAKFVERVGDEERLMQLFVLTFCDTAMTSPGNLTEWKGQLLRQLYLKARSQFRGGASTVAAATAGDARRVRELVRLQVVDEGLATEQELEGFFRGIPDRYFAQLSARQIVEHYKLAQVYHGSDAPVALSVTHRPSRGHSEVAIVSRDTRGFLTAVAGVLAAHRIDILGAVVGTRRDSAVGDPLALDIFYVRDSQGRAIPPDDARWDRIELDLASLFDGSRLRVEGAGRLLARKRPRSGLKPKVQPKVPTEVKIDNDISADYTVIDVVTEDKVGVLYSIAHALTELGLDIFLSRVATEGNRVADTFYVAGGEPPGKLTDTARLEEIRAKLHADIAEVGD
jgi:[protein-PII] uridylyltransferase